MPRSVEIFQVDAFTPIRFAGNPAGVVLNADGLADAEMLAIARELNNADTAFVLQPNATDHDIRVRFFTPRSEAAGVPLVFAKRPLPRSCSAASSRPYIRPRRSPPVM